MRFVKIEPIDRPAVYIDPEYAISIDPNHTKQKVRIRND